MSSAEQHLDPSQLRWRCDAASLGCSTTRDVVAATGIVGQARAVEALRFGLEIRAPGQNVYVRGLSGTGRLTLVRRVLEDVEPGVRPGPDWAYVRRFEQPDRPRLLRLPRGRGDAFRERMHEVGRFIAEELPRELDSEGLKAGRAQLETKAPRQSSSSPSPWKTSWPRMGSRSSSPSRSRARGP